MKKYLLFIILAVASILPSEKASGQCCQSCNLSWSAYVDYLYWSFCQPYSFANEVVTSIDATTNTLKFVDSGYHSGYRLGAGVDLNCLSFELSYTDYSPSLSKATLADQVAISFDYKSVDITIGYAYFLCCTKNYLKPFVGTKLVWLDDRSFREADTFTQRTKTQRDGYGLLLGLEGYWAIFDCQCFTTGLNVRGDFGVMHTSSKHTSESNNSGPNLTTVTVVSPYCRYLTFNEIAVSLEIGFPGFTCFSPTIMIGYETQTIVESDSLTTSFNGVLGVGGLVTRFKLDF